jgi:Tfp pilus assembly protein FimT
MSDTTCTTYIYFCMITRPIAWSATRQKLLRATPCRRGQTLIEILIVASIMVILGALSIDLLRPSSEEKIQGAVRMFAQDVEWARGATLTNPDDPASIRLMEDQTGWMVSRNSTPTVAMVSSDGASMSRVMGVGMSEAAQGVRLVSSNTSQRQVEFDPFGGVKTSPASIAMFLPDSTSKCTITFDSVTGAMKLNW